MHPPSLRLRISRKRARRDNILKRTRAFRFHDSLCTNHVCLLCNNPPEGIILRFDLKIFPHGLNLYMHPPSMRLPISHKKTRRDNVIKRTRPFRFHD